MRLDDIINEVIVIPAKGTDLEKPLRDEDTIRVYNGFSTPELLIIALTKGYSGDSKVYRKYSYEANNNPRGLFVTPDLDAAKEFGIYVLEIHARVSDLEAPVWPSGSFTGQGQMASYFDNDEERVQALKKEREKFAAHDYDFIRNSDRPELAASLTILGERQALYVGDLNKNSIRAVWISNNPGKAFSDYTRYSPKEVLSLYKKGELPTRFGNYSPKDTGSETRKAISRIVEPRDNVTIDTIADKVSKKYPNMTKEKVISFLLKDEHTTRDQLERWLWSDRQISQAMSDLEKYK